MRIKLAGDWGAADGRDQGGKIRRRRRTGAGAATPAINPLLNSRSEFSSSFSGTFTPMRGLDWH
jgi:hypothetical protein